MPPLSRSEQNCSLLIARNATSVAQWAKLPAINARNATFVAQWAKLALLMPNMPAILFKTGNYTIRNKTYIFDILTWNVEIENKRIMYEHNMVLQD